MKLRSTNLDGSIYTKFRGRGGDGGCMCVPIIVIFTGRKNRAGGRYFIPEYTVLVYWSIQCYWKEGL